MAARDIERRLAKLETREDGCTPRFAYVWIRCEADPDTVIAAARAANPGKRIFAFCWLPSEDDQPSAPMPESVQ
jgi:hypothetical protein